MPQTSEKLRAKWKTDWKAEEFLQDHFTSERGLICRRSSGYEPTDEEFSAIQYLCEEWDYEYSEER